MGKSGQLRSNIHFWVSSLLHQLIHKDQGLKDDYSICGAYLSLAYAGQRKPVFLY